jgi:hypothetical protein
VRIRTRFLLPCAASLLGYAATFGLLVSRPLSYGFLEQQMEAKLARGATLASPKLVILAGSNGPYSHRCEVVEAMLQVPCVNAGIAVGIGLDYLFARWRDILRPGDIAYLPMETAQYVRSRAATRVGPDAAIMLRHDRATLARLGPDRWGGALFSFDARAAVMAVLETMLATLRVRAAAEREQMNAWGDRVGHDRRPEASLDPPSLMGHRPLEPSAIAIRDGYGAEVIAKFVAWAKAHGAIVIGGLPTAMDTQALPD